MAICLDCLYQIKRSLTDLMLNWGTHATRAPFSLHALTQGLHYGFYPAVFLTSFFPAAGGLLLQSSTAAKLISQKSNKAQNVRWKAFHASLRHTVHTNNLPFLLKSRKTCLNQGNPHRRIHISRNLCCHKVFPSWLCLNPEILSNIQLSHQKYIPLNSGFAFTTQ